ncbi:MAG: serine/threonine protein kinase, partial [Nannocystaceae bacterium]|nr:serine/threonine protein kinase [Nannocystaceae bacterium]
MGPEDHDEAAQTVVVHDDDTRVSSSPTPAAERSLPEMVGAMVGRYRVTGLLGQGAMGIVLQGEDESLGRAVAIKLIHERVELESRGRQRLEREARTLAALSHPNVVHVYEIGSHRGRLFVAMERVGGRSLRAWLREQARPWSERLALLCAAGDGLAAAHRAGIVHRDFKPDNVLVDDDGRPRVLDFGLAVPAGSHDTGAVELAPAGLPVGMVDSGTLTATGTIMGTPAYMAPEQYQGAAPDARSDQFSFCVTLFEALWGHRPFRGDDFDALREAILAGRIDDDRPPRELPRAVVAAVRRGLSPQPQARFESMAALLSSLRAAARPRRRGAIAAAAAVLVGGITVAAWRPWRAP